MKRQVFRIHPQALISRISSKEPQSSPFSSVRNEIDKAIQRYQYSSNEFGEDITIRR